MKLKSDRFFTRKKFGGVRLALMLVLNKTVAEKILRPVIVFRKLTMKFLGCFPYSHKKKPNIIFNLYLATKFQVRLFCRRLDL